VKLFVAFKNKWTLFHERAAPKAERMSDDILRRETFTQSSAGEPLERLTLLTPRERDLFFLLLDGYTLKESAKQMSVKYSTANTHMTGIYKKLNVKSRAELIIKYHDTGRK